MFVPPRCPHADCPMHVRPETDFYQRKGCYRPRCRPWPVPRFRCKRCRRTFSRQTFRADYRDHRPDLNARLFLLLASGLGLRQSGRILGLSLRCTELKFRKIGRHLRGLNGNLRGPLPPEASLVFDEAETYEGRRSTRPLTLPAVVERRSYFVLDARAAPIRASGPMTPERQRKLAHDTARFGRRPNRSRAAVRSVLRKAAVLCRHHSTVVLATDEKSTYPRLAQQVFGAHRLLHQTTSSKLPRMSWNPLFPINHTEAMARDLIGRLRRESWLVSKQRWCLNLHLQIFAAYRNYVRPRTNQDARSPAQVLGYVDRRLWPTELLSWRQDWGQDSIHPLSHRAESVGEWRPAAA